MTVPARSASKPTRPADRAARLRPAFRTLERVAPGVGARWAIDLWCRIPTGAGRRRDLRPRPGRLVQMRRPDGGSIAVETWGEGEPVYLMHGWGGWRGQLGGFVNPLLAAGLRVVALDAPSHGDSAPGSLGPGRGTAIELADALRAAADEHGRPRAIIGHSLGAATSALAISDGLQADRLALVATSPDPMNAVEQFTTALGIGARTRKRMDVRLEAMAGRPLTDLGVGGMTPRLPAALLVHDRRDKEVPFGEVEALAAAWPEARLEITDGLGHQRILADPQVVETVVDFVASP